MSDREGKEAGIKAPRVFSGGPRGPDPEAKKKGGGYLMSSEGARPIL